VGLSRYDSLRTIGFSSPKKNNPQDQQEQTHLIQTRLPGLSEVLSTVKDAEAECAEANVEENDYTVFACQDLEFELELVVHAVGKKIVFFDNQVLIHFLFPSFRLIRFF